MMRYFKFSRYLDGDIIYDYSNHREHCVNFQKDAANWVSDDVIDQINPASTITSIPLDQSYKQKYLLIDSSGITLNPPRRVSNFDEGFALDFWFNLQSVPSLYTLNLMRLTFNGQGDILVTKASNSATLTCNYRGSSVSSSMTATTSSYFSTNNWVNYGFSVNYNTMKSYHQINSIQVDSTQSSGYTLKIQSLTLVHTSSSMSSALNAKINLLKLLYPSSCTPSCSSFTSFISEVKVFDMFRSTNSMMRYSRTDFSHQIFPSLISYWKLTYELGFFGKKLLDYALNSNDPLDISTSSYVWQIPTLSLTLCPGYAVTYVGDFICQDAGNQMTAGTLQQKTFYKFNWKNSSHMLTNPNFMGNAWKWTADFWMKKYTDTDDTVLFYVGPTEDKHDYFDDYQTRPSVMTNIRQCNVMTGVYEECYMKNFNDCRYSTACTTSIQDCSPSNNGTQGCQNMCQYSSNCENQCSNIDSCKIYCDSATDCKGYFTSSPNSQFTCPTPGKNCEATFTSSNNPLLNCVSSENCKVELATAYSTVMTMSSELVFSSDSVIDLTSCTTCSVTGYDTKNLAIICSSSTTCLITLENAWSQSSSSSPYYYNAIMAVKATTPKITITNSDRNAINCQEATDCIVSITATNSLGQSCSNTPVYNKIYAYKATGSSTSFTLDQTSGSQMGLLALDCTQASVCASAVYYGPDCTSWKYYNYINCGSASKCTTDFKYTHLVSIDCKLSPLCTNKVESSVTHFYGSNHVFPHIDCSTATTKCTNSLTDVDQYFANCQSATSCIHNFLGTSFQNDVTPHATNYATYSYIDCKSAVYCEVNSVNNANYFYINLYQAQGTSSAYHLINIQGITGYSENFFPVINARESKYVNIKASNIQDIWIDCYQAIGCKLEISDVTRSTDDQTKPQIFNFTQGGAANSLTLANAPAAYVKCQNGNSTSECSATISGTTTSYPNNCDIAQPYQTIFNKMNCNSNKGSCKMYCTSAQICQMDCREATSCVFVMTTNTYTKGTYPYRCGGKIVLNYVDCTGSTTSCINKINSGTPFFLAQCQNKCTNQIYSTDPLRLSSSGTNSGTAYYSIAPYLDCSWSTSSCTNTIQNTVEFYVNCKNNGIKCDNTVTSTGLTSAKFITYSAPSFHTLHSIIDCTSATLCTVSDTSHTPLYVDCSLATTCTTSFTSITILQIVISGDQYRYYPIVNAKTATGAVSVTTSTAGGLYVLCSTSSSNTQNCTVTLAVDNPDSYVDCGNQDCTVDLDQGGKFDMSTSRAYQSDESQYSMIFCKGRSGQKCTNILKNSAQVYVECTFNGVVCINSMTTASSVTESTTSTTNYPYFNCKDLQSGSCKNTMTTFNVGLIDCEGAISTCQSNTLSSGASGQTVYSYINVRSSKTSKNYLEKVYSGLVDCESADDCYTKIYSLTAASASKYPILYCYQTNLCQGETLSQSEALLIAIQVTGASYFSVTTASTAGHQVMYVDSTASFTMTCTTAYQCFAFCLNTQGLTTAQCTTTFKSATLSSTYSYYNYLECGGTKCINTCQSQLQCYFNCENAANCQNTFSNSHAGNNANSMLPVVNCKSSQTCVNTVSQFDGIFIDCTSNSVLCQNTISSFPKTNIVSYGTYKNMIGLVKCDNAQDCQNTLTNAKWVAIDCTGAINCLVSITTSSYVEVDCSSATTCSIYITSSNNIKVKCPGVANSCAITATKSNTLSVDCSTNPTCTQSFDQCYNIKTSCQSTTSCDLSFQDSASSLSQTNVEVDCSGSSTSCSISASLIKQLQIDCSSSLSCDITQLENTINADYQKNIYINCMNSQSCNVNSDNSDSLEINCNTATCNIVATSTFDSSVSDFKLDCSNALLCTGAVSYYDYPIVSCSGATSGTCIFQIDQLTNMEISLIDSTDPSLTCTDLSSTYSSYTGTIFIAGLTSYTVPPECYTSTSTDVYDTDGITVIDTLVTYSITIDDLTTSYSVNLASVSVSLSSFTLFNDVSTRNVATLKSTKVYGSSVTLNSDGRPNRITNYQSILQAARDEMTAKRSITMAKTMILWPKKYIYQTENGGFYKYQPESNMDNYYSSPRVEIHSPQAVDLTEIGNLQASITQSTPLNYSIDNNTCQTIHHDEAWKLANSASTNIYKNMYQKWCIYQQYQWNHITLLNDNNLWTTCVNNYCMSQLNLVSTYIQQEMRFFYSFYGKAVEFRLWQGDQTMLVRNYLGRQGPYSLSDSQNLLVYYTFSQGSSVGNLLFNSKTDKQWVSGASSNIQSLYDLSTIVDPTNNFESDVENFGPCQDGYYFGYRFYCQNSNAVLRAQGEQSNLKLMSVDFTEPAEFTMQIWFKTYVASFSSSQYIMSGAFPLYIKTDGTVNFDIYSITISSVSFSTYSGYWIALTVTQSTSSNNRNLIMYVTNNGGFLSYSATSSTISGGSWPQGQTLYLGRSSGGTLQNSGFKSFFFFDYKFSLQEIYTYSQSERYIKKGAIVYYPMNDYNLTVIIDRMANKSSPPSLTQSTSLNGFIWERDTRVLKFCPEDAEFIYDYSTDTCAPMKIFQFNQYNSYFKINNVFADITNSQLSHSNEFTIQFYVWMDTASAGYSASIMKFSAGKAASIQLTGTYATSSSVDFSLDFHGQAFSYSKSSVNLTKGWTMVNLKRAYQSALGQLKLSFQNDYSDPENSLFTYPSGSTYLDFNNELMFGDNTLLSTATQFFKGRINHIRIYRRSNSSPMLIGFNKYFDYNYNKYAYRYYLMEGSMYFSQISDLKYSPTTQLSKDNVYNVGSTLVQSSDSLRASLWAYDKYYNNYKACTLTGNSISAYELNYQFTDWTIEFMYVTSTNTGDISSVVLVGNFLQIDFILDSNPAQNTENYYFIQLTYQQSSSSTYTMITQNSYLISRVTEANHISISYNSLSQVVNFFWNGQFLETLYISSPALSLPYASGVTLSLKFDSTIFFKIFRLWNVCIKPYSLMQMLFKSTNYLNQKGKLLIYYHITHNLQYLYNKQIFYAGRMRRSDDDTNFLLMDSSPALATSFTGILRKNFCNDNQTYSLSAGSCYLRAYLPLGLQYANQIDLPLSDQGGFTNTVSQSDKDFTISFWALLKPNRAAGSMIQFNFGTKYLIREISSGSDQQLNLYIGSLASVTNLGLRSTISLSFTYYSDWHFMHLVYKASSGTLQIYLNNQLLATKSTVITTSTAGLSYSITLCPSQFDGSNPDCDTVIAYLKVYTNSDITYSDQCDYRLSKIDFYADLVSYWPLSYLSDNIPTYNILTDEGPYGYSSVIFSQSDTSSAKWVAMNQFYPEGGEDIFFCDKGEMFIRHNQSSTDEASLHQLRFKRSNINTQVNIVQSLYQSLDWAVEFWFKFKAQDFKPYNYPATIIIASHDSSCTTDFRLKFELPLISGLLNHQRTTKTTVQDTVNSALVQTNTGNILKDGKWYHYGISNSYWKKILNIITNFVTETITPTVAYQKLTFCDLGLGDKTGSSSTAADDIMIFIRELRSWNSYRTLGQFLAFSNKPLFSMTSNLMSYIKLTESTLSIYDRQISQFDVTDTAQYTLDSSIAKFELDGSDYFDSDCPPGFIFGISVLLHGCYPFTPSSYAVASSNKAQLSYDTGTYITQKAQNNDLQFTLALQLIATQNTDTYDILTINNVLKVYRQQLGYYCTFYFSDLARTISVPGSYDATTSSKFNTFFIMFDQKEKTITFQSGNNPQTDITSFIFQERVLNTFLIDGSISIGDISTSSLSKEAISQIVIYNKILNLNEIIMITSNGIRGVAGRDSEILYSYLPITTDSLYRDDMISYFFPLQQEEMPTWVFSNSNRYTSLYENDRRITLCPPNYSLQSDATTSSYCAQRGSIVLTGLQPLSLTTVSIRENVRYAFTFQEKFKVSGLSLGGPNESNYVSILYWQQAFQFKLTSTTLYLDLFDKNQVVSNTYSVLSNIANDGKWHELIASLFHQTWYVYLDQQLVFKVPDVLSEYNVTSNDGKQFNFQIYGDSASVRLHLSEFIVYGVPFSTIEKYPQRFQGWLDKRMYDGILLGYYSFDETFRLTFSDLSTYQASTAISVEIDQSDPIFWAYEEDTNLFPREQDTSIMQLSQGGTSYSQIFAKNSYLYFSGSTSGLQVGQTLFDSEFTVELCYMKFSDTNKFAELFGAYLNALNTTSIMFNGDSTQLMFQPSYLNPYSGSQFQPNLNSYFIATGSLNTWECITASTSFLEKFTYFTNFYRLQGVDKFQYYDQYDSSTKRALPNSSPIARDTRNLFIGQKNFIGSIREVRFWSQYNKPGIMRRMYRSWPLSFHNTNLTYYYSMNEGLGLTVQDRVQGRIATFSQSLARWFKFDVDSNKLELCEGERVFSNGGYCLYADKFLKFSSTSFFSFTVKQNPTSQYNLMSHATVFMWINIRQIDKTRSGSLRILDFSIEERYTASIERDKTFRLQASSGTSIMSSINVDSIFDQWGFLMFGCSSFVGSCEVHWGTFQDKQWDITLDTGSVLDPVYISSLTTWTQRDTCKITVTPTIEISIFNIFMREFQIHQVLVPYKAFLLKMNLAVKAKQSPAMIVQLKMDEMSGDRIYNHAHKFSSLSFAFVDIPDITWVYYKETLDISAAQYGNKVKYISCNKENYTYVGDHCEYFECATECYASQIIGHCRGWSNLECAFLNPNGTGMVYDPTYNDYLACFRYCTYCEVPYLNTRCSGCVSGTRSYTDKKGLYAVANQSCWENCPDSTYLSSTTGVCEDCPQYCICDPTNPTYCQKCMNETFLFDRVRNLCLITCPLKTLYNSDSETCQDCSPSCQKCKGFTQYDCITCIDGLTMVTLSGTSKKSICVDRTCSQGYYFDDGLGSCEQCNSACSTCAGAWVDDCLTCNFQYQRYNGLCQSCQEISSLDDRYNGLWDSKASACDEVCGDGRLMGVDQCDDGGNANGDGCSSSCQIESQWACIGGSPTSPSVCSPIKGIDVEPKAPKKTVQTSSSSATGIVYVYFTDKVDKSPSYSNSPKNCFKFEVAGNGNYPLDFDVLVYVDPPTSNWVVEISYIAYFDNSQDNLVIYPSLYCHSFLQFFSISLTCKDLFSPRDGKGKIEDITNKLVKVPKFSRTVSASAQLGSVMSSFQTIMIIFLCTNVGLSIILGDGLQHMWNLINYLQLLYFLPLINVNFHPLSSTVFELLGFVLADFFQFLPNGFALIINMDDLNDYQYNDRFTNLNFEGILLINNYYQKLEVFIMIGVLYPLVYVGSLIKNRFISRPFKYILEKMSFNFPLQFFIEMYLEIAVTIWLNMYVGLWFNNQAQKVSSFIAIVVFSIVTLFPIFIYQVIMQNFDKLSLHSFHEKFGAIVEATRFQLNSTMCQMWLPTFLFRRYTYGAILVVLDQPVVQIALCITQSIMTLAFILKQKPFDSWDLNLLFVVNEGTVLVSFIITCFYMMDYSEEEGQLISWALIAVLGIDVMTNMCFVVYDLYRKFKKLFKRISIKLEIQRRKKQGLPWADLKKQLDENNQAHFKPPASEQGSIVPTLEGKQLIFEGKKATPTRQRRKRSNFIDIEDSSQSQLNLVGDGSPNFNPSNISQIFASGDKDEEVFISRIDQLKREKLMTLQTQLKIEADLLREINTNEEFLDEVFDRKRPIPIVGITKDATDEKPSKRENDALKQGIKKLQKRELQFNRFQSMASQQDVNLESTGQMSLNQTQLGFNDTMVNQELLANQSQITDLESSQTINERIGSRFKRLSTFQRTAHDMALSEFSIQEEDTQRNLSEVQGTGPMVVNVYNFGLVGSVNISEGGMNLQQEPKFIKSAFRVTKGKKKAKKGVSFYVDNLAETRNESTIQEEEAEEAFRLNQDNVEDILDRMMRDETQTVNNYTQLMSDQNSQPMASSSQQFTSHLRLQRRANEKSKTSQFVQSQNQSTLLEEQSSREAPFEELKRDRASQEQTKRGKKDRFRKRKTTNNDYDDEVDDDPFQNVFQQKFPEFNQRK